MTKIICLLIFMFPILIFGQTALNDPNLKATIQKVHDNRDNLFKTFKGKKEPDMGLGLGDSYSTTISLYGTKGSLSQTNFDETMNFRISSSDYKKATKANFEKAFDDISKILQSTFDDLEIKEKQDDKSKEMVLFEKGKDTNAPVADDNSPKYYLSIQYKEETPGSYSLFFFITTKKKK